MPWGPALVRFVFGGGPFRWFGEEYIFVVDLYGFQLQILRRRRFFTGRAGRGGESERWEIEWLRPSGEHMTDQDWTTWYARAMTVYLNGDAIAEPDEYGRRVVDDSFLVLINASGEDIDFTLPGEDYDQPLRGTGLATCCPSATPLGLTLD